MSDAINAQTIPQNFYDIVSPKLLTQPEPQYLYAKLLLNALAASLPIPDDIGLPGREINPNGAPYSQLDQLQLVISDPIGKEIFAAQVNMLGLPGMTVRLNRPKFTDTTYTEASRRLTSGSSISTSGLAVSAEQNILTLREYAGPYDQDNGRVAPFAVDKAAAQNGVHNLVSMVGLHHSRDFHKFLDAWVVSTLDLGTSAIYPKGMTANNDATGKGMFALDYETLVRTSRTMDDAKLPRLPDGRRLLVLTPTGGAQLSLDKGFQRQAKYFEQFNTLFAGTYVASLPQFHIFTSNTLTTSSNTSSVSIHYGHAVAPGALGCGMGMKPEIRPNTNDDFGRSVLTVWLAYLALEMLDNRFVYSVRYTEDG